MVDNPFLKRFLPCLLGFNGIHGSYVLKRKVESFQMWIFC